MNNMFSATDKERQVIELEKLEAHLNKEAANTFSQLFEKLSKEDQLVIIDKVRNSVQETAADLLDGQLRAKYLDKVKRNREATQFMFALLKGKKPSASGPGGENENE